MIVGVYDFRNHILLRSTTHHSNQGLVFPGFINLHSRKASISKGESGGSPTPYRPEGKMTGVLVCWILGLGSLVAWNAVLTIGDYYYQLFPRYHPARVLTVVYQAVGFCTTVILVYNEAKVDTRMRNMAAFVLFFLSTFTLLMLDIGTSGKGGSGIYTGICIIVAVFGLAEAHVQGGMVGDLSFMCPEFIQSFLAGLAASGALTSALRLMTKAAFENSHDGLRKSAKRTRPKLNLASVLNCLMISAVLFLAISTLIQLLCIFLYAYIFPKLPIMKHFRLKAASEGSKTVTADLAAAGIQKQVDDGEEFSRLSTKELLMKNIDYALDLYLTFALSFSIFPGFLYENTGFHQLGSWYPLVLIAIHNVANLVSRYIPLIECLKIKSRKCLMFAVLSRFLFIPAFYFTAKYGDQGWMILLTSLLGITNGYLTVCVFLQAPRGYKGPEQNALGNVLMMFLLGGIFSGMTLDWLWLINNGTF